jgi:GTP-binding protein Era
MPDTGELAHSGFVSIIGRPNAGKSTLLNALIGSKLAIVSNKPQTTRAIVQGVLTQPDAQVVFLDTPGIHKSTTSMNRRMMRSVRDAIEERDLLLFVADSTAHFTEEERHAVSAVERVDTPVCLVLNKIDRLADKRLLLPRIEEFKALREFADYLPISALTGEGLDALKSAIVDRLPPGPPYFPPDHITDQPERFLIAELIREKVLEATRQEVPHSVAVVVETYEDKRNLTHIGAVILVERPGQKAIVIGAGGSLLKAAGTKARLEIEALLGRKVFLELNVKLRPGWRENPEFLNLIDWRSTLSAELKSGSETE